MRSSFLFRVVFLTTVLVIAWQCCGLVRAADFKAGDEVAAICQTEIKVGNNPLVSIPAGSYLKVQKVNGDWLRVTVTSAGKQIDGWVYAKHVKTFMEDQRIAQGAKQPNDQKSAKRAATRQLITAEMIDAQFISRAEDRAAAQTAIARGQVGAGDLAGAKATAGHIEDQTSRAMAYWAIAFRQSKMGDLAGARQTLQSARSEALLIGDDFERAATLRLVARVQATVGDVTAAKTTAAEIGVATQRSLAYFAVAEAQIKAKDLKGAKDTALQIGDEFLKGLALDEIIDVEAKTGSTTAVFDVIAGATTDPRVSCELLGAAAEEILHTP
jgi:hypothetical protein